jgi:chromosome segregation ATPase
MCHFPWCQSTRQALEEINQRLGRIEERQDRIMSEQQADVDQITGQLQAEDTDINSLRTQVTSGQQALDTAITNLEAQVAAGSAPDLTELKAAAAVLAGDQPNLDAAVAALTSDPNAAQPTPVPSNPPASS